MISQIYGKYSVSVIFLRQNFESFCTMYHKKPLDNVNPDVARSNSANFSLKLMIETKSYQNP